MTFKNSIWIVVWALLFVVFSANAQKLPLLDLESPDDGVWFTYNEKSLESEVLPEKKAILWPGGDLQTGREVVRLSEPIKATHLDFVQTFHPGARTFDWMAACGLAHRKNLLTPEIPTVATYQVLYEDSSKVNIAVRYEEGVNNWYRVHEVGPLLWASPEVVHTYQPDNGEKAAVYNMHWPNPKPELGILSISFLPDESGKKAYGDLLLFSVTARREAPTGRNWFVNRRPWGKDNNPGTFDEPLSSIHQAVEKAAPGDNIYIRDGYYALSEPVRLDFTGEKGKWLTLSSWFGETPELEAYGITFQYRTSRGVIQASGDPSYLRIKGLHIYNSRGAGISVNGKSQPGSAWGVTENVEALFNTTYHTNTMAIIIHTVNNVKVIGNKVVRPHSIPMSSHQETGDVTSFDHGSQEAIDLSRNKGFEIAFNQVYGGSKEAIDCISIEDGTIHHNYVHDCLNGIYIDSWSVPIRRLKIHHNYIHNAFNGIPLATEGSNDLYDLDIYNNIIINSKSVGIGVNEATYKANPAKVQKIQVFNNTIHKSGGHASSIGWQSSGIDIGGFKDNEQFKNIMVQDNIITYTTGRPIANVYVGKPQHEITITNNLIYPEGDSTPAWMVNEQKRKVNNYNVRGEKVIVAEPEYMNTDRGDFRLQKGSPAIGKGTNSTDIGALPYGTAWLPGMDWAGQVTAFYYPDSKWEPLMIPLDKFTMHRNHLQRPSWFQRNRYGVDFQNLPAGEQSFAGTTFYIPDETGFTGPTVLALKARSAEVEEESIEDIPVKKTARKLAFLQVYHMHTDDIEKGEQLFHYRVNYADGSREVIPVQWQVHVGDWLGGSKELEDLDQARLAWNQDVLKKRGGTTQIRLYKMVWENPRPEVEITSLDIIHDREYLEGSPAVFGISLTE